MNELTCTLCFNHKPRYLRQCKCLYCEDCRQKSQEVCFCGGSGGWHDLSQHIPEEIKYLHLDHIQLLKKVSETTQEKIFNIVQGSFGFLNNTLEIKSHHQRQLQKYLMTKVKGLQQENEDLKKKNMKNNQPPYEIKENLVSFSQLEDFKFSTPRGVRPVAPSSGSKKPFDHEAFSMFMIKK
jgi:hypothetical protein